VTLLPVMLIKLFKLFVFKEFNWQDWEIQKQKNSLTKVFHKL